MRPMFRSQQWVFEALPATLLRVSGVGWLGLLGLLSLGWFGCSDASQKPNVLLITVDTLRADRLGFYGADSARTPHLDALAAEGTWFRFATAPLPETRPSHFTLFTSRYPRDHGVVSNTQTLSEEALTLAEVYSEAGYQTAAFAGCALLDEASGAGQGFDELFVGSKPQRPSDEVLSDVLAYLDRIDHGRPVFLWVHLFDPHMPYEPGHRREVGRDEQWTARLPSFTWPDLLALAEDHEGDLPIGAVERGRELYEGEVEVVDDTVGRLRKALEEQNLWDQTIVALTADHGECFEDGIYFEHSHCMGEGALSVPMVLRGPGIPIQARKEVSEHIDLAPTLARLSGLSIPPAFRGRDLLAFEVDSGRIAYFQHPVYPQDQLESRRDVLQRFRSAGGEATRNVLGDRLQVGARDGRYKYVRTGDRERLFDLRSDSLETTDLSEVEIEVLHNLRRSVRVWLRDNPMTLVPQETINPELREQLEALGYL